ncbi:SRPBCC domain-containing protein [Lentzea sp. PSKA42]|uniref:SRPBCC domain-containing protein n=1 Tax=Lentzea indica TaxID=2604800 RepID=A0ABX1FPG3_9PSEU|nr:SRPBCC domain-containing protein [Lentzea indica]NKE60551.1 SRPBCC domain-containing protein [Lentzea indica]
MGHAFEGTDEIEVPASVEDVWEAIATGPGIDSWFMGRNEVANGQVKMAFGGYEPTSTITAWDPPHHLAYDSGKAPDGRFIAYEFLVEGREHSSTVLRMVTSGFLPGDDWADEFEAMTLGGALFRRTLAEYLHHFAGRTARPLTVFGPMISDWDAAWKTLDAALADKLPGAVEYHRNAHTLGLRTERGMYRFLRGFHGPMIAAHHVFEGDESEQDWQSFLDTTLGEQK